MSEQSSWTEDRESNTSSQDQTVPADSESHQIASDKRDEPHLDLNSSQDEYLSLIFRDGLDMPIDGLTFIATYPSGFVCTAESTLSGAIALPKPKAEEGEVKVEVKNSSGRKQPVCSIDLAKCEGAVIVRSPKTKAKVSLQPHQQIAPAKTPSAAPKPPEKVAKKQEGSASSTPEKVDRSQAWWGANGALGKAWAWLSEKHFFGGAPAPAPAASAKAAAQGLSSAGQPVSALVGPEGPNKDNLRLGRNNVYRQVILDASKRLGLIPQALCALMDCEAGKVSEKIALMRPDGTPVKDKKGRPVFKRVTELWDANAGNASSGAAGLTQFLAATWLAHVLIPGRYIHEKSVASGWVKQVADSKGKKSWMFVLEDGSTTLQPYAKRM
ncbi:MAG: hypothetical protein KGI52_16110, partial [Burkholderiales bacterium]|nr:hypothetical protein [Burkholderiales bacterium]